MDRYVAELAPAPAAILDATGQPIQGQFAGRCAAIDWSQLPADLRRSALWRRLHHKRWQYIGVAGADCFIGCAIVDVGWTNTAFAYLFDRRQGRVVAGVSRDGLPGVTARVADVPATGAASRFSWLAASLAFVETAPGRFALRIDAPGGFSVALELHDPGTPWLFACGQVAGGVWHSTHKSSALAVSGSASVGGQRYALDGAHASLDHSNGLLPRDTQWRWASAHSPALGFNLQSGYFADQENALWLDGRLIPLGSATFRFDPANTLAVWHIHTDDGLLELEFRPEGERREDRNLLVAASRYVQPVGTFHGRVRAAADAPWRTVSNLLGVAEDHHSRW
ncbi:DUF2804 domain-containing protein [Chitinimonas sp.]|uniref:DUF2804 domain-containing protein n=1 Tax=Chitinimonas sp. TaxID=1934313 RepID=UPI0035B13B1D